MFTKSDLHLDQLKHLKRKERKREKLRRKWGEKEGWTYRGMTDDERKDGRRKGMKQE